MDIRASVRLPPIAPNISPAGADNKTVKKYSSEKNFLTNISNQRECEGKYFTNPLKAITIKWYTDGSKRSKETGAEVFGQEIKYSDLKVSMGML